MGDATDTLVIGAFVAGLVFATTWVAGDRERAPRSAVVAFLTAAAMNYLGRRLLAGRLETDAA